MATQFISWIGQWLEWALLHDSPSPNFLSDVAAFEAMIVALGVPMSYDIVSRLSDRYQSDVVAKRYRAHFVVRWLPYFLIPHIVLAITLKFFAGENPDFGLWRFFAWLTFVGFIVFAIALIRFFVLTMRYGWQLTHLLQRLSSEAERALNSTRRLSRQQEVFIERVEGIGDILVFETGKNRAKTVIEGLSHIEFLVNRFLEIKKKEPGRFENLLLSQDFLKLMKKDPAEASLRIQIQPDKHLLSFSTVVTQLMRVHRAALQSRKR